uniref:Uncharacterized protein n=1 Tax=viral metagenome TaxID=1070528 RepID=A0A6C0AZW9_9ZZZZ
MSKNDETSFFGTLQKNEVLEKSSPFILLPGITLIGRKIGEEQNKIVGQKGGGKSAKQQSNTLGILMHYPHFSNLENYILLDAFITDEQIALLQEQLQLRLRSDPNINKYRHRLRSVVFNDPSVENNIDSRLFFSLVILSARLSPAYMLRTNSERQLYTELDELFDRGDGEEFTPDNIYESISRFLTTNPAVTLDYFLDLINGNTMYNLYKANYVNQDTELSKELIAKRLKTWLKNVTYRIPISYLFNQYTNQEKELLDADTDICTTISQFTTAVSGNPPISVLPPSLFSMKPEEEVDFDKMSEFLYNIAPGAVKKKLNKDTQNVSTTASSSSSSSSPTMAKSRLRSKSIPQASTTAPIKIKSILKKNSTIKAKGTSKSTGTGKGTKKMLRFSPSTKPSSSA